MLAYRLNIIFKRVAIEKYVMIQTPYFERARALKWATAAGEPPPSPKRI